MASTLASHGVTNGNIDLSSFIPKLESYQADGQDYLYALEPMSRNLFWAGGLREAGIIDVGEEQGSDAGLIRPFYNAAYRIRKVSIKMPTIDYEVDKYTRIPKPKSIVYPNEITIDWFEDVYNSVRKYHLDWLQRWYMREFDCWRCGAQGKFRSMRVIAFHFVNDGDVGASIIEVPRIQPILALDVSGMAPTNFGDDWTFDHGSDGNDEWLSITYKVSKINFYYSIDFEVDGANLDANVTKEASTYKGSALAWSPIKFSQDGSNDSSELSLENIRIIRSLTSSTSTENALS